eukprot:2736511-Alexandrium_andersonii.AAC.1
MATSMLPWSAPRSVKSTGLRGIWSILGSGSVGSASAPGGVDGGPLVATSGVQWSRLGISMTPTALP